MRAGGGYGIRLFTLRGGRKSNGGLQAGAENDAGGSAFACRTRERGPTARPSAPLAPRPLVHFLRLWVSVWSHRVYVCALLAALCTSLRLRRYTVYRAICVQAVSCETDHAATPAAAFAPVAPPAPDAPSARLGCGRLARSADAEPTPSCASTPNKVCGSWGAGQAKGASLLRL